MKKTIKKKTSECCNAPMLGGVQCEVCGSNGKFSTGTAIVKRLDTILKFLKPEIKTAARATEQATEERFINNGDGTISDTKTRLMWQKEGSQERLNYAQAEEFVAELNKEQYLNWRLPTVEELFLLVDRTRSNPAINPLFKCESAGFWSSTPYAAGNTDYAWFVGFYNGNVSGSYRDSDYFVRPVRPSAISPHR